MAKRRTSYAPPTTVVNDEDLVQRPTPTYESMAARWELIDDLWGGTEAMRLAGRKWLPQEPLEEDKTYNNRLERSFLYNAFKETVQRLVSKPFSKPIQLVNADGLDPRLAALEKDADRAGTSLTQFASEVMLQALKYGKHHILVDYPKVEKFETLADERKKGGRPYFVHVGAKSLIGWRTATNPDGSDKLSMIRYRDCRVEESGKFGEKFVNLVRVWTPTEYAVWSQTDEGSDIYTLEVDNSGRHSFGEVPLVTFYTKRTGVLTAEPPLAELAWQNVCHWQSSSDQRNILRFARCGLLFFKGVSEEELAGKIAIGPNNCITVRSTEADGKVIEHQGHAIKAGADDISAIEQRMETLGLQPLVDRTAMSTATGKMLDEGRTHTLIEKWVRDLENTLNEAFRIAAKWLNVQLPKDFSVDITDDFLIDLASEVELRMLDQARARGDIDQKTFLEEIRRRGVISEQINVEKVMERVAEEGPNLNDPDLMPPGTDPEDDEDDDGEEDA